MRNCALGGHSRDFLLEILLKSWLVLVVANLDNLVLILMLIVIELVLARAFFGALGPYRAPRPNKKARETQFWVLEHVFLRG